MLNIANTLKIILEDKPTFRRKQIEQAWFNTAINSYNEITTLPKELHEKLKDIPWLSLEVHTNLKSQLDNTRKILFKLHDNNFIETVIMGRKNLKQKQLSFQASSEESQSDNLQRFLPAVKMTNRDTNDDRYTICISSQAGCPMRCAFCATGKAGFKRQLSAEEIIDQYRFSQRLLAPEGARVNNIVMMGQGEPLLNYDNVKRALNIILENSDLGETKITVSTAGVVPAMEQILKDDNFPPVRWAVSLHSAIEESRKQIMPSNRKGFLEFLVQWANDYHTKFPSRTHFIGLEYIMLGGVNDNEHHLQALIKLARRMPHIRINLIPYNYIGDEPVDNVNYFARTPHEQIEHWHTELMNAGFTSTIRYSQGQDIMAACGQLQNTIKI